MLKNIKNQILNFIKRIKSNNLTFFVIVFSLVSIRFLYCGFKYFPQLDDYIQHHNYAQQIEQAYDGNIIKFILELGFLSARPLAGILDITLWSWLWPCSWVSILLISAMYSFAAVEFNKLFNKLFGTSNFFLIVFALLPLGIEGTYWLSASTRIVPGLLFAALSADFFCSFVEKGKWYKLPLSFLFQLLTFGFYEQTAVLSCALNGLIGLYYIAKKVYFRWIFAPMGILSAIIYFKFTGWVNEAFGASVIYGGRTRIFEEITPWYHEVFLPNLTSQIRSAFFGGGFYTLVNGFFRGIKFIISDFAFLYILLIIAICILFGYYSGRKEKTCEKKKLTSEVIQFVFSPIFGILLAIAPITPFFIIEGEPWFSFRGTVASFAGIALVADYFMRLITANNKKAIACLSAACAFVFCICSVSEISDYRANYEEDMKAVGVVATIADNHPDGGKVAIINLNASYVDEVNTRYHEHISGVTESSWALTGAVRCYNNNQREWIEYIPISLQNYPTYKGWEYNTKTLKNMVGIYLYNHEKGSIEKLEIVIHDDHYFSLYYADGRRFAEVFETQAAVDSPLYNGVIVEEN